jgi:hypothetical protein
MSSVQEEGRGGRRGSLALRAAALVGIGAAALAFGLGLDDAASAPSSTRPTVPLTVIPDRPTG